jgi:ABC-type glutathione transport system ATPase component
MSSLPFDNGPLVAVEGLRIAHEATGDVIVDEVSFAVTRGSTLGIVGESGSGKTLTCRALLGVLPEGFGVTAGSIRLDGTDVTGYAERDWNRLRGTTISAVFQDPASYLNPSIVIGRQIEEVLRVKRGLPRRAARSEALELLRSVSIRDPEAVVRQYPYELSGGMLQRVLLATAIALRPRILIADEVTTALDVTVQAEVLDLLADVQAAHDLTLIVVSHDLAVVGQVCDEVIVLRDGVIVEAGTTAQVLHSPRHPYTQTLVDEHHRYGLDRFLTKVETP